MKGIAGSDMGRAYPETPGQESPRSDDPRSGVWHGIASCARHGGFRAQRRHYRPGQSQKPVTTIGTMMVRQVRDGRARKPVFGSRPEVLWIGKNGSAIGKSRDERHRPGHAKTQQVGASIRNGKATRHGSGHARRDNDLGLRMGRNPAIAPIPRPIAKSTVTRRICERICAMAAPKAGRVNYSTDVAGHCSGRTTISQTTITATKGAPCPSQDR